jgi:hypothetical protein
MDRKESQGTRSVRPRDLSLEAALDAGLLSFATKHRMPGITRSVCRNCLIEQLVESTRRIKYISVIRNQNLSDLRLDPNSELFDPLKAAILHQRRQDVDEAFWMVFFFVHFGKHRSTGWRLARDIYGALGSSKNWTWERVSSNPKAFRRWLDSNITRLQNDGIARHFGNHRKYESLDAQSDRGTGAAVESYVHWVGPDRTHQRIIDQALTWARGNPRKAFDYLFHSMKVASFGRTAKFDYLTMLAKLHLAQIDAGSPYLSGSSGPLRGARLLFGGNVNTDIKPTQLNNWLVELARDLKVDMQTLEDGLCNWQKSPELFKPFRG